MPSTISEIEYLLKTGDPDFPQTGLKRDSVFKMNKLATIDKKLIVGEIGKVSSNLQKIIDQKLKKALGLSEA